MLININATGDVHALIYSIRTGVDQLNKILEINETLGFY